MTWLQNIEGRVAWAYDADQLCLFLRADSPNGPVHAVADGGTIVWTPHLEGARMDPFVAISGREGGSTPGALFGAIRDAIAEYAGERSGDAAKARLDAVERHLEDMRALVWKEGRP